jgi:hypothetical protein
MKIIENSKIIYNQLEIFDFYLNFNKIEFNKIENKIKTYKVFLIKMNEFNSSYKLNSEKNLKEINSLKFGKIKILNLIEDTKIFNVNLLKGKYSDFFKTLIAFEEKLKSIEDKFISFKKKFYKKIENLKIKFYSNDLDDFIKTQLEYFIGNFRKKILESELKENNKDNINNISTNKINKENYNDLLSSSFTSEAEKNLFKELLQTFENFWGSFLRDSDLKKEINELNKIQVKIY